MARELARRAARRRPLLDVAATQFPHAVVDDPAHGCARWNLDAPERSAARARTLRLADFDPDQPHLLAATAGRGAARAAERASRARRRSATSMWSALRHGHGVTGHLSVRPRSARVRPPARHSRARRLPRGRRLRRWPRRSGAARSLRPGRGRRLPRVARRAGRARRRRLRRQSLPLRGLPLPRRSSGAVPAICATRPARSSSGLTATGAANCTSRPRCCLRASPRRLRPRSELASRRRQRRRVLPLGVRHRRGRAPARRRPRCGRDSARHEHVHAGSDAPRARVRRSRRRPSVRDEHRLRQRRPARTVRDRRGTGVLRAAATRSATGGGRRACCPSISARRSTSSTRSGSGATTCAR